MAIKRAKRLIPGELNNKIAAIKKLDTKHAPVTWYEDSLSDGWECPKCHKADYRLEKEPCTPDWEHQISDAWKLILEMVNIGSCPILVYDDNGHYAISTDGSSPVSLDGKALKEKAQFLSIVYPEDWADTAELAICKSYIKDMESNGS
jgi:hypothetical protein